LLPTDSPFDSVMLLYTVLSLKKLRVKVRLARFFRWCGLFFALIHETPCPCGFHSSSVRSEKTDMLSLYPQLRQIISVERIITHSGFLLHGCSLTVVRRK